MWLKTGLMVAVLMASMTMSARAADINLSKAQLERLGIRTAPAVTATEQPLISLPGRITAPLNAQLAVVAPFAGTVLSINALEGSVVKKGDALLTIASGDYLAARAELQQNEAAYKAARAASERAGQLVKEGIAAQARAEETAARATQLQAVVDSLRRRVVLAQGGDKSPGAYVLAAPDDGQVAGVAADPGDSVAEMAAIVTLRTKNVLWLEAPLPADLVGQTLPGQVVTVEPSGSRGTVIAVGGNIDPRSRSTTLRAEIPSPEGLLPGQNVHVVLFSRAMAGALQVPRAAAVRIGGADMVFVAREGGFDRVEVEIIARGAQAVTIRGALEADALVAVAGLTELKALAQQD